MSATKKNSKTTAPQAPPKTREERETDLRNATTPREILNAAFNVNAETLVSDPRYDVLAGLVNAFDEYQHKLDWMATNLADELAKTKMDGIPRIYSTIGSSSLWQDVPRLASRIETLREALQGMVRNADQGFFASIARRIAPRA